MPLSFTFNDGLEDGEISDSGTQARPSKKQNKSKGKRKRSPSASSVQFSSFKSYSRSDDHTLSPKQRSELLTSGAYTQPAKYQKSLSTVPETQRVMIDTDTNAQPPRKKHKVAGDSKPSQRSQQTHPPVGNSSQSQNAIVQAAKAVKAPRNKPTRKERAQGNKSEHARTDFSAQPLFLDRPGRLNYDVTLCPECLSRTLPSTTIWPPPCTPAVMRKFLASEYCLPRTAQERGNTQLVMNVRDGQPTDTRTCIAIAPDMCHVPVVPGACGIFITGRRDWLKYDSVRLFNQSPAGTWLYRGEYTLEYVRPAAANELAKDARWINRQAQAICSQKIPSFRRLRATVRKCKMEGEATEDDILMEASFNKNYTEDELDVSEMEIAMRAAVIELDLVVIRCLGYDHDFARHLTTRYNSTRGANK